MGRSREEHKATKIKAPKIKGKCWRCEKPMQAKSRYEICQACKVSFEYRFGEETTEIHWPK